jgi:hypothetical protein
VARRVGACALPAALTLSLAVNIALSRQLRAATRVDGRTPAVGAVVGPINVRTIDGTRVTLAFTSSRMPTILYYFDPSCRWCERNWNNVVTLAGATQARYRFVAISTATELQPFVARQRLPVEVYGGLDPADRRAMGLGGTPHTVVLSADARVLASWVGAFDTRVQDKVQRYFGVALPGLIAR